MNKEQSRELLAGMIDSQKYILTLEEDYDSYGGLPCSQEMWDSVIEFLVNLIASLEEDDISDSLLHPDIHYDGGKVMSVWWYGIDSTLGLGINFENQVFGYYGESKSPQFGIKTVKSTEDFPINHETISNLSRTLVEVLKNR